jgi:hypothetical protein
VWGAGLGAAGGLPPAIQWGALGYYTLGFALATFLMTTYNGQRGPSLKWFFYAYYPAHLLVLWLVAQAAAPRGFRLSPCERLLLNAKRAAPKHRP